MRSMTGYGRGEWVGADASRVTAELRTVNRRQAEVVVTLPRDLAVLEVKVQGYLAPRLSRGRCEVRIQSVRGTADAAAPLRWNRARARAWVDLCREMQRTLDLPGASAEPTWETLIRCPGVMEASDEEGPDPEQEWERIRPALEQAWQALDRMRLREGGLLEKDLVDQVDRMRQFLDQVRQRAPEVRQRQREQLRIRLAQAGLDGIPLDDERLMKEWVLYCDRCDISEEMTRLESHFQQFEDARSLGEPVGRRLDFLAQEMQREINTLGTKGSDALLSAWVVELKTTLERFREQAMNVE
jgi:uncharacterized protein (TIGR00255 family)